MYVSLVLVLADADNQFIENFKAPKGLLPLVKDDTLHPSNSPWFYYGGSYAGARAAHMRSQYPHLVWGAIASSGTFLYTWSRILTNK